MLIVSLLALLEYLAVFVQGIRFALRTNSRRQADNTEVAYIMLGSAIYVLSFAMLWFFEPWKLTYNTPPSVMLVGTTIFSASYFFRRIGAMINGRERRRTDRRAEDDDADRRVRRPIE